MKEGIAVLLLFFNKVETTGLVLERILEAKPSVLLLAQDGAREDNAHDEKAVPECRKRVEELLAGIDWPCEIYRNYAEKNMSCDPREYSAISWAFGIVDKLIILEDDCLCSSSFFPFMEGILIAKTVTILHRLVPVVDGLPGNVVGMMWRELQRIMITWMILI